MGIGNRNSLYFLVIGLLVSLPLMGIGNGVNSSASTGSIQPHYPSWGSGTLVLRRLLARNGQLITPHGDRERPRLRARRTRSFHLITPHGDREQEVFRLEKEFQTCSLPLMGIGNQRSGHRVQEDGSAHYPSWGSGTLHFAAVSSRGGHNTITKSRHWLRITRLSLDGQEFFARAHVQFTEVRTNFSHANRLFRLAWGRRARVCSVSTLRRCACSGKQVSISGLRGR